MQSHEKIGSSRSQHCMRFSTFRRKKAFISNQIPNKKSRIQGGSLARRGDKFKGGRSQHCTYFSIFCCEAMKNLAAENLSTVYAFPSFGEKCEGSGSQHCIRLSTFFMKKTCNKKHLKSSSPKQERMRGPKKRVSLRGLNLSFL